jgi:hypothetical protein
MFTQQYLKEYVHYDPETGIFTWVFSKNAHYPIVLGNRADTVSKGYCRVGIKRVRYAAHRLAWLYMTGDWPKNMIDHINGNPLDNRFCNLRDVTASVNLQNQRKASPRNKSGFLGVHKNVKGRFEATICVLGKRHWLGAHTTPEQAYEAYLQAKRILHQGCTI